MPVFYSYNRFINTNINSLNLEIMNTQILSSSVKNEINAICEQEPKTVTKKHINIELICALLTLGAIIGGVIVLNSLGLIRNFYGI